MTSAPNMLDMAAAKALFGEIPIPIRDLVETTDAILFIVQGSRFQYVNPAFERITGYTRQELSEVDFWDTVHPDYREAVQRRGMARQQGHEVPSRYEFKALSKAGEELWFDLTATATEFEGSLAVVGTAFDITARKRAEEALRDSEARLRAFANAVPDVAFILDDSGLYVEVLALPSKEKLLFADPDQLKGRRLHDILPKRNADQFLTVVSETIKAHEPQVLEYALDVQSGRRWFEGRTAPLQIDGDRPMVVWVSRDITERVLAERERVNAREELEARVERAIESGNTYGLSFRELSVLSLVADGRPDKEIAAILGIKPRTVGKHVEHILKKMSVSSRTEATVLAIKQEIVN